MIHVRSSALSKQQDKILKQMRDGSLRAMPKYAVMVDVDAFQENTVRPR